MSESYPNSLDAGIPNVDVREQLAALGIAATGDDRYDAALLRLATTPLRRHRGDA